MSPVCCAMLELSVQLLVHQLRVRRSRPAAATCEPSGDQSTAFSAAVGPLRFWKFQAGATFQMRTIASLPAEASCAPVGSNAREFTAAGAVMLATTEKPESDQTAMAPLELDAANRPPPSEKSTLVTLPAIVRLAAYAQVEVFHTCTTPSEPLEASRLPSGDQATSLTVPLWARILVIWVPLSPHRTSTVPSSAPTAMRESGA